MERRTGHVKATLSDTASALPHRRWLNVAIRLALAWAMLLAALLRWGEHYIALFLPLYREVIGVLAPDYRILKLVTDSVEGRIEIVVYTLASDGTPQRLLTAWSSLGDALQHPLLLFSLLLAWPLSGLREALSRLALALPLLMLLEALGVPLALLGSLAQVDGATLALLDGWLRLLNNGGSWALSIVAALVVIGLTRPVHSSPRDLPREA